MERKKEKQIIHLCFASDMHPMNCDGPYGGFCEHCERKKMEGHDPATCALCDPEYDYMPNKYWKKKGKKKSVE